MHTLMSRLILSAVLLFTLACGEGCQEPSNSSTGEDMSDDMTTGEDDMAEDMSPEERAPTDVYGFVNGCYTLHARAPGGGDAAAFLAATEDGASFTFSADDEAEASRFFMKASELATYLLHDEGEHYLVGDGGGFARQEELLSDIFLLDDDYLPGAQWKVEPSPEDETRARLVHVASGEYLTMAGLSAREDEAAVVTLTPTTGCAEHPELTLDAEGTVTPREFEDGSLFGFVETHSHILSNFGFGGAGIFHGSAFHPFGVEHALPDCEMFHGKHGRADLFGYGFDQGDDLNQDEMLVALLLGRTPKFNHFTDGYPTFTDWPSAPDSSTHQTQYYLWIQRAYMSGLRLMVQHAATNRVICELITGADVQPQRYSCNDMVAVDRILEETRKLERYIDAQHGGPGQGWFRIVESPAEARQVIGEGKMAVVLGIETSHLFDCYVVPPEGEARCTEQDVIERLDAYHAKGVRAIFPVHKYDNGFSAGDGQRVIIEMGNFAQSGHWSNFTDDCPGVPAKFDQGPVAFGGINQPRDDYFAAPPNDMSDFADDPIATLVDYSDLLQEGPLEGEYCQNAGLTPLGEFLFAELMARGMIIEVDHLPQRSYKRAFEILEANDYPAVGSHGGNYDGKLYELGGVSKFNFGRCADPDEPGALTRGMKRRLALIEEKGGFVAEGFGFDLNGFAGGPGPRFGEDSRCTEPQSNPVTYPFTSYDGQITFTQPRAGERVFDFNTEGMVHIGLIPELIEDARRDGATDEDLEPLFKSAEGYLRMWEKAERRGRELSQER